MAEKAETEVACTICLELFTEPKVLPCCHTFCKGCLEGILEKSKSKEKLACPQCRAEHQVPSNGPEGFLNDYTLSADQTKKLKSTAKVNTCELCDEQGTAVSYCSVCSALLCDTCTNAHKTIKFLKNHKIESLSSSEAHTPSRKSNVLYCNQHPDKALELYCKSCQCLACLHCFVASHNGHDLGNIDTETRKGVEKQIKELVTEVKSKLSEYEENLEYISEVEKETTLQPVQLKDEINSYFDSLVTTLESRRAALLEEVESSVNKDLKEVWAQKEHVENTIIGMRGTLTFAKRSLECTHDRELLLLGSQVMARLEELKKIEWESESTMTIDQTSRKFSHKKLTGLNVLGELNTSTTTTTSSDISVIDMSGSAKLGHEVKFNVGCTAKLKKLKQLQQLNVKVLHGNQRTEITHPPTVSPNPDRTTWSVTFTPVVSGAHVVQVEAKHGNKIVKNETVINVIGNLAIGDRVQRGPDWIPDYTEEDGGAGNKGVVSTYTDTTNEYDVKIQWDADGSSCDYRWGTGGYYDIQLAR